MNRTTVTIHSLSFIPPVSWCVLIIVQIFILIMFTSVHKPGNPGREFHNYYTTVRFLSRVTTQPDCDIVIDMFIKHE